LTVRIIRWFPSDEEVVIALVGLDKRLGVTQAAISRMEQPHDLLLSTLNAYLQAIGGTARMVVSFADGHQTTLDLSQLA